MNAAAEPFQAQKALSSNGGSMKVVVFGDSILKGVITIPESKNLFDVTPNDALTYAQKKLGFELDNRSIYGNISSKGLIKMQKYFEKGEQPDFCIIEFGSNDCDYDWNIFAPGAELPPFDQIQPKVPFDDYMKNIEAMVKLCREHKVTPILMNLIPYVCDDWFKTITKGHDADAIIKFLNGTAETLGKNQERYNTALTNFANENKVKLLDYWKQAVTIPDFKKKYMGPDGIHLNEDGYGHLGIAWWTFLSYAPAIKEF